MSLRFKSSGTLPASNSPETASPENIEAGVVVSFIRNRAHRAENRAHAVFLAREGAEFFAAEPAPIAPEAHLAPVMPLSKEVTITETVTPTEAPHSEQLDRLAQARQAAEQAQAA